MKKKKEKEKGRYDSLRSAVLDLLTPNPSINQQVAVGPRISPSNGSVAGWSAVLPVVLVRRLEHVFALQLGIQPGADEEGAAHLAMQRVRLLGRRGEAVFEHHRDQVVDPLGGGLGTEVEGLHGREGLPEDHHSVHVSVQHRLETSHGFYNPIQSETETFPATPHVKGQKEILTFDSYPERNFISMDFFRTPSLLPSAADRIIYKHTLQVSPILIPYPRFYLLLLIRRFK